VIEDSILGWEAAAVMPDFVIDGLREEDAQRVQAGVFYGWLNSNRAYLAELPQGPGRMLVTTFRFEGYGQDPFATMLLDQMLSTAATKQAAEKFGSGHDFSRAVSNETMMGFSR
jgi:hypothetical protein